MTFKTDEIKTKKRRQQKNILFLKPIAEKEKFLCRMFNVMTAKNAKDAENITKHVK
jgi:hypothetical protein